MNIKATLFKINKNLDISFFTSLLIIFISALSINYIFIKEALGDDRFSQQRFTNSESPLHTPTYDGSNEATHPSVVYIPDGFNGYKYWMALTPYPNGNDDFENPEILVSNDGSNFKYLKLLQSPLTVPDDVKLGGHYSDVNLCYANGQLEVYFRYNPHVEGSNGPDNSANFVYMMKSKDGIHWSEKKQVLSQCTFAEKYNYVSPSIIYENGIYNIWFSNYSSNLYHTKTKDWITFDPVMTCELSNKPDNIKIWHHDIIKTTLGYEAVISAYIDNNSGIQDLYYSSSLDGIKFQGFTMVLKPSSASGFDNGTLYKSSLVRLPDKYLLYYSAKDKEGHWHIGLAKNIGVD